MLKEKNIILTGASRGIGKAMLELFAQNGANIISINKNQNDEFVSFCENLSKETDVEIKNYFFDLQDSAAIKDFFMDIRKMKIEIHGLVNNAGLMSTSLFQMSSTEKAKEEMGVNFFAVFELTQFIIKLMQRQRAGSIVNISSVVALDGFSGKTTYGATKGALISFTKSLAKELGAFNIRANCIAPGIIDTKLLEGTSEEEIKKTISMTSLKRIGQPADVAAATMFLLSDYSSYISGQVIRVDGGM